MVFTRAEPELPPLPSSPLMAGVVPVVAEPDPLMPVPPPLPQPARAVTTAFDRTGSALKFAFRKTGEGVKTAFVVISK
jgi:hypothetical protein